MKGARVLFPSHPMTELDRVIWGSQSGYTDLNLENNRIHKFMVAEQIIAPDASYWSFSTIRGVAHLKATALNRLAQVDSGR